jgi:hypothetical protein
MTRTAAVTLHSALVELLSAAREEETAHLWTEAPSPVVRAHFFGVWGMLAIVPPNLTFTPESTASSATEPEAVDLCVECEESMQVEPSLWPLHHFAGVDDDPEAYARCELRLLSGEDDGLPFGFESAIDLALFERTLRIAATSSRAATPSSPAATTASAANAAATSDAAGVSGAARAASVSQPAAARVEASAKRQRTGARAQKGAELKESLREVATLYSTRHKGEAKEAFAAIDSGPAATIGSAKGRAYELRDLLFTVGSFNLTKATLMKFLGLKEVKLLLDEDFTKTREECADAQTATAMLQVGAALGHASHATPRSPHTCYDCRRRSDF